MLETFEMDKVDQALRWPGGGDTTTSPNHERSVCSCLSGVWTESAADPMH